MHIIAKSIDDYLDNCPSDRRDALRKLRQVILENIPKGFKEELSYGMPGYVVPHNVYPSGYHCDPKLPLPFASFASQKNFIALYHMGLYADSNVLTWFQNEYPKHCRRKLDMGKSCIRFKKVEDIPFGLIAELMTKFTPADWIKLYEQNIKR